MKSLLKALFNAILIGSFGGWLLMIFVGDLHSAFGWPIHIGFHDATIILGLGTLLAAWGTAIISSVASYFWNDGSKPSIQTPSCPFVEHGMPCPSGAPEDCPLRPTNQ